MWLLLAAAPLSESLLLCAAQLSRGLISHAVHDWSGVKNKVRIILESLSCFVFFLIFKFNTAYNHITHGFFPFKFRPVWLLHVCLCGSFGCVQVGAEECSNDQEAKRDSSRTWPTIPQRGRGSQPKLLWRWVFNAITSADLQSKLYNHCRHALCSSCPHTLRECERARAQTMFIFITDFRGFRLRFHWSLHFPSVKEHRLKQILEISPHHVFGSTGMIDNDSGYLFCDRWYMKRAWTLVFHCFGV